MDKGILQRYSTWAKVNLENQIEVSLKSLGINGDDDIKKAKLVGDVMTIEGDPTSYPAGMFGKRKDIIDLVTRNGYRNVIEEFAYTWFNRFVALRFMEVHGFLDHGFRILSNTSGGIEPEILKNINLVKDELRLDINLCNDYKQQGKLEELFRHVLIKQCNVLSGILPMLFSSDLGYLELLLPKTLLKGETVVTRLVEIPEDAFLEDVEIIGWMYQFYISSKKDAVYASKKTITKDTLPAVTQLFTPDWIVRYMAENSVGRLWLESYPDSSLRSEMKYYVEDAEQTEDVKKKIDEIKYKNVNPENISIIEPCCGSGHILVYVFDLLYKMYEERGYQKRDIPTLILKNNLVGLDVDKRAAQLASFSLIMKARKVNNRFFSKEYYEFPHVYELQDSKLLIELGYRKCIKDLNLLGEEEIDLIDYIVRTFENGKTIGSLLKVEPIDFARLERNLNKISDNAISNLFNMEFLNEGMKRLRVLMEQAKVLAAKYDVMITNPPYIAPTDMETPIREYAVNAYPSSKTDMYAMFMQTNFVKPLGFKAMINMHGWMFLSSFKELRREYPRNFTILNMVHLGSKAFDADSVGTIVQTVTWVAKESVIKGYLGKYFRLVDSTQKESDFLAVTTESTNTKIEYLSTMDKFELITGMPYAYWASDAVISAFKNKMCDVSKYAKSEGKNVTTKNEKYILYFWEVDYSKVGTFDYKWLPCATGGKIRKWYGNVINVIDWSEKARKFYKDNPAGRIIREEYWKLSGLTWGKFGSFVPSFRYLRKDYMYQETAVLQFNEAETFMLLGILNSNSSNVFLQILNPTINFQLQDICAIPVMNMDLDTKNIINQYVNTCIDLSRSDWDSFETSLDFSEHPFMRLSKSLGDTTTTKYAMQHHYGRYIKVDSPIELCFMLWQGECKERFDKLKNSEEKLNRIFIDIYGLQNELRPDVEEKEITVRLAEKERDVKSFVSYLVGIAMGRYSLDFSGIVYAGGQWDNSKYISFQPDDDGIIPIYNGIGMEDGLTTILINLIKHIYGENTYKENIDFIAETLGKKSNESSEETLNRYLNGEFYKDHLKMYQKRPIYWMFSSGDKSGFKCLVYIHRYNEDTLARVNAKYFLPESTRKKNELDELNGKITHSEGHEKLKYEKERQNLAAAYNEAIEYGQVLDHMANQYISIDLDAGVKANYEKFQGIEIVTDGGSKVKKDLLYPIK